MLLHSDGFQVARCHCILWRALFWHSPATKMKENMLKYMGAAVKFGSLLAYVQCLRFKVLGIASVQ